MSIKELETAVKKLPASDLNRFSSWFEKHMADLWDRQIQKDVRAGKLDKLGQRAIEDFEKGRCTEL